MQELRGRVAVVTGAGSGIGRALDATRALVEPLGVRVTTAHIDVADRAAVHRHADEVVAAHGAVHLVVNNAGVALGTTIAEMTYADFSWLMGINFWGVVHGTKAFLSHLERAQEGHVVNISSVFGLIGVPTQAAYNAAKFAVRGFTEALREELELAGSRVSATCVHPGGIRTNIARHSRLGAARTAPEQAARAILRGIRRNARRVLIGADALLIDRLQRWLPTAYQRLVVAAARRRLPRGSAPSR